MKKIMLIGLAMCLVWLSGCALTDSIVKLKCDDFDKITKQDNFPPITLRKFVDGRRGDNDPKFVYFKSSNFGKTQGRITSQDIAIDDCTTNTVKRGLEKAGFKVADDSDLVLSGKIISLDSRAQAGFWSVAIESTMMVNVELIQNKTKLGKELLTPKGKIDGKNAIGIDDYQDSLGLMYQDLLVMILDFIKPLIPGK